MAKSADFTESYAMPSPLAAVDVTSSSVKTVDNMRAILLMGLGFFAFAAADVQAKVLTESLHPFQIVWLRQMGLFLGVIVLLAIKGMHILRSSHPKLQVARGVCAVTSACSFVFAISYVPLADAVAVSFVAPFIVTVFGALLLREPVGIRRWTAVTVGFVGMLIVIRPGMGVFHPAIFLVVLAASFFAIRQILSRWLAGDDSFLTTVAYTSITSTGILTLAQPFVWENPQNITVWALIIGVATCAAFGEVLVIRALDIGQAVVLAPMHYSLIIWGTFYGFVIFAELPDIWTLAGCAVIMASGIYTLQRERKASKKAA